MEPLRSLNTHGQSPHLRVDTSYEQVRNAKRKALTRPNRLRVIVRLITLTVGASIVGVLAHAAFVWYSTRNYILMQPHGIRMRGWPAQMDLIPTWIMLAVAVIAIVVQIVALLTLLRGVYRLRESAWHTWGLFLTSIVGIATWITAAVYFKLQDNKGERNWTLWSWSCSHKDLVNGKMSFQTMCVELNYCFYIAVIVAALELLNLSLFGLHLRKAKRQGSYTTITVQKV
ncbi:uncharacterized protein Z520_06497 [Fonsecaea multimorphosa CBS 102226]|uniref:MARVEL domain-containing protein n=1 Tax=Fonsecaea multimorphosa CBS 102226 TaxID=1442371 RepID=A0A0D2K3H0_9EURO|nr:uncharacterized protein Z520_06497 [Fonsecaea multimorphosa CBS 102226]KIX97719.1 hypothetical protein Z520_06497 [Fonsecaea multimorphosa CBS 102226]